MRGADREGHDSGQSPDVPPAGLTWQAYVEHFVRELGGWTALAEALIHRAASHAEVSEDLQSVEKGLRRLARREHRAGGQYGRWMLRLFGVPSAIEDWARWLAQYHSRFADLPTSLRLAQLRLWDCPPISESRVSAWIHVGIASVVHRMAELDHCRARLELAAQGAERAGPAAVLEVKLLAARLATDDGERAAAQRLLSDAALLLPQAGLTRADRLCYAARVAQQRAYHLTKPMPGTEPDLAGALQLFQDIEEDAALPFVAFRKCAGLAYCTWKLGDAEAGARLARLAAEHAGDGGFVRFRIMALNLLTRMVGPDEAAALNARAASLAQQLEDEDLRSRVARVARSQSGA